MAFILKSTETPVQTGNYTASFGQTVRCDPTNGGLVVTLPTPMIPTATDSDVGRQLRVKNVSDSPNNITLSPPTGTIDGAASSVMNTPRQSVILEWDGSNFLVIGGGATVAQEYTDLDFFGGGANIWARTSESSVNIWASKSPWD